MNFRHKLNNTFCLCIVTETIAPETTINVQNATTPTIIPTTINVQNGTTLVVIPTTTIPQTNDSGKKLCRFVYFDQGSDMNI